MADNMTTTQIEVGPGATNATINFEAGILECYERFSWQRALDYPGQDRLHRLNRKLESRIKTHNKSEPENKRMSLEERKAIGVKMMKVLLFMDPSAGIEGFEPYCVKNPLTSKCPNYDWTDYPPTPGKYLDDIEEEPENVDHPIEVVLRDMNNKDARQKIKDEVNTQKEGKFRLTIKRDIRNVLSLRVLVNGTFLKHPNGDKSLSTLHRLNAYDQNGGLVAKLVATDDLTVEDEKDGHRILNSLFERFDEGHSKPIRAAETAVGVLSQFGQEHRLSPEEGDN
ncbi:nonstructural protein 1 [Influenza B virus (B/NYMC BX-15(Lee/1940-Hawaii/33/2004))]|uniref:Non-structural protein 1 n=1 Tax=Influenza B virus (B/reassortant/NYMC BX-15(Lee/1940 x Hawaii/33/2004)) TaxID=1171630 RepID=I0B7L8_9INFB|nr:nonstructural protein 1 [Influenza B virus (B/NYMC BX-15(Lee/1940-Hawaii/33/2004))]AFH58266.1 nonstructural protein 1 [Influenza B virus (B/reassortant/NYMC BX-15(Lee/1940 x Hawaii/33/2004))]